MFSQMERIVGWGKQSLAPALVWPWKPFKYAKCGPVVPQCRVQSFCKICVERSLSRMWDYQGSFSKDNYHQSTHQLQTLKDWHPQDTQIQLVVQNKLHLWLLSWLIQSIISIIGFLVNTGIPSSFLYPKIAHRSTRYLTRGWCGANCIF